MSEMATFPDDGRFAGTSQSDLRARIGWICHALRIAAALWIVWIVVFAAIHWSNKAQILEGYGRLFATDLTGVSAARYAAALAVVAIDCLVVTAVAFCLWQLASTYLAGRVFMLEAAVWLRRTAIAGMAALLADVIGRVMVASILVGKVLPLSPRGFYYLMPQDLLHLIFATFVFALAHIFKVAAEMAEDQAQIV